MNDYVVNVKLAEINKDLSEIKKNLYELKCTIKSENDLWDGSDLVRNWKISERTLADWRKKKMIGYIQIKKKIYYPREAREKFLYENFKVGGNYGN